MLRTLFCLSLIITVVYSDCCTLSETIKSKGKCDADNTIECHVKHYGIYCCDDNVKKAMRSYADISSKILGFIVDHNDKEFVSSLDVSSKTVEDLLQNFTSKCKRYTKVMATKHLLQYHMFNNPDDILDELTQAVMYLETAAYRLQHIQKLHSERPCVEFTAEQYLSIYKSRYNLNLIKHSLKHWTNTTLNCCGQWNKIILKH